MTEDRLKYLRLSLVSGAKLPFTEAKRLITYLGEVSSHEFKLIISSKARNGLELFLGLNPDTVSSIKKHLYALNPNFKLELVKKSEAIATRPTKNLNLAFKKHYAYPLFEPAKSEASALKAVLEYITQLDKREQIEIELSAQSVQPLKVKLHQKRLLSGASIKLSDPSLVGQTLRVSSAILVGAITGLRTILNLLQSGSGSKEYSNMHKVVDPRSIMLLDKLYEPLFKTSLSIRVRAPSPKKTKDLADNLSLVLNHFAKDSGYQQFKSKASRSLDIYSASDLASLYYFEDHNLLKYVSSSKTLPVPNELKLENLPGSVVIGTNSYKGVDSDLVLSAKARQRHLYITGATGSGKSTLLASLVLQDIENGQGISLIDPHGDLAQDVLDRIPDGRMEDVIYFDPSNLGSSISLNLLETKSAKGTAQYKMECDQITESVISLFRKVFSSEDIDSHRIEYVLRNSIQTSLSIPGSTIFTIFRLLTDSSYRLSVIPTISDQNLINFWRNELGRAGEYQRVKMSAGVTSKIGRFLFSEPTKQVFGQSKSTLDIDELMNEKKVLICNFSKGKLGEDGSKLFATALLTKLQLAALARAKITPSNRVDHYLYVDEFQNFAPNVLIQMISEARKYKLYLTMAEQSPSQQDAHATSIILANVGNLLCFRAASPKDERLLIPSFDNSLSASDLNNLPAYNFFFRSVAEEVLPPTSGQTKPLPEPDLVTPGLTSSSENLSLQLASN